MTTLTGKKILLFCARFFGYQDEIKNMLMKWGASVDYYDQRPSNSFFTKAVIRINNNLLKRKIDEYYLDIFDKTAAVKYDYVLFISPETITEELLITLKNRQPQAKYLLYMWDSLQNKNKTIRQLLPLFDRKLSFDRNDCAEQSNNMFYRPLFYLTAYSSLIRQSKHKYDLLFIGTIHSDRYKILNAVRQSCDANGLKTFYYMFFPSKILFYAKRLTDRNFVKAKATDFHFSALTQKDVLELVGESNVVIDIQHPNQTGLTMRTIEMLGANRKLITTNQDIINYDFYHPDNIHVINRDRLVLDINFFNSVFAPIDPEIYERYSINGWIKDVFEAKSIG